jgi:hypothetical protein
VEDLKVDLSPGDRTILNAIRGKSKAEVNAAKMLTVELNNSHIDTENWPFVNTLTGMRRG